MRNGSETGGWRWSDDTVTPGRSRKNVWIQLEQLVSQDISWGSVDGCCLIKNDAIRFEMS